MFEAFGWYIIILLLGFINLPITFSAFSRLPDKGLSFSKPLGLLFIGLVAWWIGNLKILAFDSLTCWISILLLGGLNLSLLIIRPGLAGQLKIFFALPEDRKLFLASEGLFLGSFAFLLIVRSFILDTNSFTERFFNFGFINSIVTSTTLPPPDPWFGGQAINYYYGSHLLIGIMCKLSGVAVSTGFTLGMGLVFGLSAQASFGLVANLVKLAGVKSGRAIYFGLLGPLFLMISGNLTFLRSLLQTGFLAPGDKFFPHKLDILGMTGLIFDQTPDGEPVWILTEFPANSFLKGDLQANQMDLIFILVVLGLNFQILSQPKKWSLGGRGWGWTSLILAGTLLGALNFINGVDFYPFFAFTLLVLGMAEIIAGGRWFSILVRWGVQVAGIFAFIKLIYFFYSTNFANMVRTEPVETLANFPVIGFLSRFFGLNTANHTNLSEYLWHFGFFLFPILIFFGLKILRLWEVETKTELKPFPAPLNRGLKASSFLFGALGAWSLAGAFQDFQNSNLTLPGLVAPLLSLTAAAWTLLPGALESLLKRPRLAIEGMAGLLFFAIGALIHFELLGLLIFLIYFSYRFFWLNFKKFKPDTSLNPGAESFVFLCIGLASSLVLASEVIFTRDVEGGGTRFNMVLKCWQEAWILYSLGAAFSTWRVWVGIKISSSVLLIREKPRAATSFSFQNFFSAWKTGSGPGRQLFFLLKRFPPGLVEEPEFSSTFTFNPTEKLKLKPETKGISRVEVTTKGHPLKERQLFPPRKGSLGRTWAGLFLILLVVALAGPAFYLRQISTNFSNNYGLDSEAWYSQVFPEEYPAMRWLRDYVKADPSRRGILLEDNAQLYSYGSRVSVYTTLPNPVGWVGHELQWRGYLDPQQIWTPWVETNWIYQTTDASQAKALLEKNKVRYVFVGQIENGSGSLYSDHLEFKNFSQEALTKFSTFMTTLYSDPVNNIYIYAFY